MNRPGEAIVHYQRAAELQTQTPVESLLSMGEIASCKILTREWGLRLGAVEGRFSLMLVDVSTGKTVCVVNTDLGI